MVAEVASAGDGSWWPDWQPISMLATIASLNGEVRVTPREHYATLLKLAPRRIFDDDRAGQARHGESLEWWDVCRHPSDVCRFSLC